MSSYIRRLSLVFVLTAFSIGVGAVVSQQGGQIPLRADQAASAGGVYDFTWSPDGKNIAYISMQSGTSDVWIIPSTGGTARRITSSAALKKQPRWSKDGKWIAFVTIQSGDAGDIFVANVDDQIVTNLTESPADDREPAWSPDSRQIAFISRTGNRTRAALIDRETKSAKTLVEAAVQQLAWSPDGKNIAYVANPLLTNDNRRENDDIFLLPSEGGMPRLLTPGTTRFRDVAPTWAPDSRQIAYASDTSGHSNIKVVDIQTGAQKTFVAGTVDSLQPRWSPDGSDIAYVRNEDSRMNVWVSSVQGSGRNLKVSDRDGVNGGYDFPDTAPRGKIEWSPDGKRIAFTHSDPARPSDVWIANIDGSRSIQLTNSMPPELRREGRYVWPDVMTYRSFDGTDVSALVYKPRGMKLKTGHPTLLMFRDAIDGQHAISWDPFAQFFVSNGYLVFAPNVRGSGGLGRDFRQLVYGQGGDADVRDAFIGLDRLSADGLVDTQRIGVFGAGTGGFLTTAALIKDEGRFKAAVCLYGIVDAVTAASYPRMGAWTRYMIGESPMTSPLPFYERSLVNFVDKLRTPIIFLYAGEDANAPFQQLQQFAVQAEVKGKWFDYRTFDTEAEGWQTWRPNNLRQALEAMDALFDKYLLDHDREIRLSRNR
jgi:dipeptidyl aminopeptidase/acylaminoacyl peptidase